ncbi:integrase [uncultured Mediterranean phage uvDeep-CGR2-KM18-C74]|nr:integrase [uncultured Mediterranean phage uvDeep-CGR2-KM18-C74]
MAKRGRKNYGTKRERPKNSGTWEFQVNTGQRDPITQKPIRRTRTFHSRPGDDEAAETALRLFWAEVYNNPVVDDSIRLHTFIKTKFWPEHVQTKRSPTQHYYKNYINKWVIPYLGDYALRDLTTFHVTAWKNSLTRNTSLKDTSVLHAFSVLRTILNMAVKWDHITISPLSKVDPPTTGDNESRQVTVEECEAFLLRAHSERYWFVPTWLAIWTGMRRSEIFGLRWEFVDFENRVLKVNNSFSMYPHETTKEPEIWFGDPKAKKSKRTISLGSATVDILRQWKKFQEETVEYYPDKMPDVLFHKHSPVKSLKGCVFLDPKGYPMVPDSYTQYVRRTGLKMELPHINGPHVFRHAHATIGHRAGVDLKSLQARMGHSNYSTTYNIYVSTDDEMDRDVTERVEKVIMFDPEVTGKTFLNYKRRGKYQA